MPGDMVHILTDTSEIATVGMVFPSGIGTIVFEEGQQRREAVVSFLSVQTVGDYQGKIDKIVLDALKPGEKIRVLGSGTGRGDFQELPIIEVLVNDGRTTLSEHLVGLGLAVPRKEILEKHSRREYLIEKLAFARRNENGIWHEYEPITSVGDGLTSLLAKETQPPPSAPEWIAKSGFILLFIALLCAGVARSIRNRAEKVDGVKPPMLKRMGRGITQYVFGIYPISNFRGK